MCIMETLNMNVVKSMLDQYPFLLELVDRVDSISSNVDMLVRENERLREENCRLLSLLESAAK